MSFLKKVFGNTRKPEGFLGNLMARGMNQGSHAILAEWGFSHVALNGNETAVDLGCGGGANVGRLLKMLPSGNVSGLDYSDVSVKISKETNAEAIRSGKCEILLGNVLSMPFPDCSFDVATAFETVYFWPDIEKSFAEVFRILKDGGVFLITNESNGKNEASLKWTSVIEGMSCYTAEELTALLKKAGFHDITADDDNAKDRLCIIAKK